MFENVSVIGFLRTTAVLFHIEGPMKKSAFCLVLVFQKGRVNFR